MFFSAPCLNCETECAAPGDLFCGLECRAEHEGWTDEEFFAHREYESDRAAWYDLDR